MRHIVSFWCNSRDVNHTDKVLPIMAILRLEFPPLSEIAPSGNQEIVRVSAVSSLIPFLKN